MVKHIKLNGWLLTVSLLCAAYSVETPAQTLYSNPCVKWQESSLYVRHSCPLPVLTGNYNAIFAFVKHSGLTNSDIATCRLVFTDIFGQETSPPPIGRDYGGWSPFYRRYNTATKTYEPYSAAIGYTWPRYNYLYSAVRFECREQVPTVRYFDVTAIMTGLVP